MKTSENKGRQREKQKEVPRRGIRNDAEDGKASGATQIKRRKI